MRRLKLLAGLVALAVCIYPLLAKKKKPEEITQTLALPPEGAGGDRIHGRREKGDESVGAGVRLRPGGLERHSAGESRVAGAEIGGRSEDGAASRRLRARRRAAGDLLLQHPRRLRRR